MAENGWPVIPTADRNGKTSRGVCPLCRGEMRAYDFDKLFEGVDSHTNLGMHMGLVEGRPGIVALDFDVDTEPDGVSLFKLLSKEHPEYFKGCVIERTARKGIHVYYKRPPGLVKEGDLYPDIGINRMWGCHVLLTTEHNTTCWPSRTPFGTYRVISENNFTNTGPEDLPVLPEGLLSSSSRKRPVFHDEPLCKDDASAILDSLIEVNTYNGVLNNWFALRLSRELAGHYSNGVITLDDMRSVLARVYSRVKWKGEKRLPVEEVMNKGLQDPALFPYVHWPRIRDERWKRRQHGTPLKSSADCSSITPAEFHMDQEFHLNPFHHVIAVYLRDAHKMGGSLEYWKIMPEDVPVIQRVLVEAFVWATEWFEKDHRDAAIELAAYGRGYGLEGKSIMEMLYVFDHRCPWPNGEPRRIVYHAMDNVGSNWPRVPRSLLWEVYRKLPAWECSIDVTQRPVEPRLCIRMGTM